MKKQKLKKIPKYKPNQLLEVEWLDAETVASWVTPQEAIKEPQSKFITAGYYSGMDKKFLYLSWSIGIKGNLQRSKASIPLGCIEKITRK